MSSFLRKARLLLLSFVLLFSLSSCSSFFQADGMMIEDITTKQDTETGDTTVTITFTDDYYDPVVFTIPAPEDGKEGPQGPIGNGIKSIDRITEDGKAYLLITFTDPDMEPARIELQDAVSVVSILSSYDTETGVTTITITLSDGTEETFTIQDGKDGAGIKDIVSEQDEEGNTTITISYTDGREDTVIQIPYKKGNDGEDGRGIASITTQTANGIYYLYITYTNGDEDVLQFDMPESTRWFRGNGAPGVDITLEAKSGDFYFDLTNCTIYLFNGFLWNEIANLRNDTIQCTVEFDATTNGGILDGDYLSKVLCYKGESLAISQIPTASKEGCTFLGWYTSVLGPKDPRSGKFTDLTPVTKEYTVLYACFEEI